MTGPDPEAFDAIARRGAPALAWEVLRRDPAYRAVWRNLTAMPAAGFAADAAFAAEWGLHFP